MPESLLDGFPWCQASSVFQTYRRTLEVKLFKVLGVSSRLRVSVVFVPGRPGRGKYLLLLRPLCLEQRRCCPVLCRQAQGPVTVAILELASNTPDPEEDRSQPWKAWGKPVPTGRNRPPARQRGGLRVSSGSKHLPESPAAAMISNQPGGGPETGDALRERRQRRQYRPSH
jgi:hypothetical protein